MVKYVETNICPSTTSDDVVFLEDKTVYYVDIDKTICHGETYETSKPDRNMIKKLNDMYDSNKYIIIYWTARGSCSGRDWTDFSKKQLKSWGVKYHSVQANKAYYDNFLDDKNISLNEFNNE